MPISTEPGGTEQDFTVYVEADALIISGTIIDQDGNAVNGTDCTVNLLVKEDLADADADAVATGTATCDSEGAMAAKVSLAGLDPDRDYHYSGVILFPADYATTALQSETLPWITGTIHARRQATRSAT